MRIIQVLLFLLAVTLLISGCAANSQSVSGSSIVSAPTAPPTEDNTMNDNDASVKHRFPSALEQIPADYYSVAAQQGTLEELFYDTWESMTYEQKITPLTKRAIVYLPYGYSDERQYPVFYLMHGGWSNETAYLGTPESPGDLKNILDHAIADGLVQPMIVVCPTYNNLSGEDSADYGLAIQLTDNYHNELINDLIPAVEEHYSTYAGDATREGLKASRDHRAFAGFSMGSVATWRIFQYCLDEFRYFFPSSGNLTTDGDYMVSIVKDSGHTWDDFFIFAASGTDDFAYSAFKSQITAMANAEDGVFRYADNEQEGNLYFLEQEGGVHSGVYAVEYIYNALRWVWNDEMGS